MPRPGYQQRRSSPLTPLSFYRICGRPNQNERPPLPAGHRLSWGLLTDGTVLDGETYPFPVFET